MNFKAYLQRLGTIYVHPGNRGRRFSAYLSAARWVIRVHWRHRPDTVKAPHGIRMRRYSDSQGARSLAYYGFYSSFDSMKFCERFLHAGDAFLDLGANIGLFTCLAAAVVGKRGRVDCFEASSKNFARLRENIALNGWRHVHPAHLALGPEEGMTTFPADADEVGFVPVDELGASDHDEETRVAALDEVLPEDIFYTLGKLDVEGFELPCLRGARRHLEQANPPIWFFEVNGSSHRYGISEEELFAHLRSLGFRLGKYDAAKHQIDFSAHLWDDVIAVSERGAALLIERLPDLQIV